MNVFELALGLALGWALAPFLATILMFGLYLGLLLMAAALGAFSDLSYRRRMRKLGKKKLNR